MTNKTVFVDSSAWISFNVASDTNYQRSVSIFSSFDLKTKAYISLFILNETITKIRKILGQEKASVLYSQFIKLEKEKSLIILPVDRRVIEKSFKLLEQHPSPNTFSLTDATNIIFCQEYKIPTLFTFDRDFKKLKIPQLNLIP
ncbi:PIN domain-containing protein [Candidatus Gottesmanbacteria bacterium]|nr:PIN domain-containing protein [Candidatus Gottesmanbacteria bacterium]